jgi:hypothetical protein
LQSPGAPIGDGTEQHERCLFAASVTKYADFAGIARAGMLTWPRRFRDVLPAVFSDIPARVKSLRDLGL